MHPDYLFLRRCAQLTHLCQNEEDEVAMLDLASLVRQLLLDKSSLADVVNTSKISLRFVTRRTDYPRGPRVQATPVGEPPIVETPPAFECIFGSIDAIGANLPQSERVSLTSDEFKGHKIGRIKGEPFTVKQVIKLAANIKGGRHFDVRPTDPEVAVFGDIKRDGTPNPNMIDMLSALNVLIGRTVLRGLEPLIEDVRRRHPHL